MLEILFVWWLTRKVGKVVKERGCKPGWFQVLTVVAWIGGELAGIMLGTLLTQGEGGCAIYMMAFLGALIGVGIVFAFANSLAVDPNLLASSGPPVFKAPINSDNTQLSYYLERADSLARSGQLDQAAQVLEEALSKRPDWAPGMAGSPSEGSSPQGTSASGYALLVHLAGKGGNQEAALRYFTRMLELTPERPGSALRAAREVGIEKQVQAIAKAKGLPWQWWLA